LTTREVANTKSLNNLPVHIIWTITIQEHLRQVQEQSSRSVKDVAVDARSSQNEIFTNAVVINVVVAMTAAVVAVTVAVTVVVAMTAAAVAVMAEVVAMTAAVAIAVMAAVTAAVASVLLLFSVFLVPLILP
jgi:hypothetical protein